MRNPKTLLLWGVVAAGAGLLISLVSTARLLTLLMVQSIVPPTFWQLPLVLLIVSGICVVAGIVLVVLALTSGAKQQALVALGLLCIKPFNIYNNPGG